MIYEKDYLLRIIKQTIAAFASVVFNKDNKIYELPLEDQYKSSEGMLHDWLTMVNDGKINEAEDMLYEQFDADNKKALQDAILFYSYVNELDDDYLAKCNYTREEIKQGVKEIARLSGMESFLNVLAGIENS